MSHPSVSVHLGNALTKVAKASRRVRLSAPVHWEDDWSTKTGNNGRSTDSVLRRTMGSRSNRASTPSEAKRNIASSQVGLGRSVPQP